MVRVKLVSKYPISYAIDREKVEVTADGRSGFVSVTSRADIASNKFVIESDYVNVESEVAFGKKIPASGLVAEYTFFEGAGTTLYDTVGNYNGSIYGAVWRQLPTGKYVLDFDGKDDYVESAVDQKIVSEGEPATVLAWVRFTNVSKYDHAITCQGDWHIGLHYNHYPDAVQEFRYHHAINESTFKMINWKWDSPDTNWHMVGGIYDDTADEVGIIFDGEIKIMDKGIVNGNRGPFKTFRIGRGVGEKCPADANIILQGNIGLVLIYQRKLTDAKINKIYKTTAPLFGIEV